MPTQQEEGMLNKIIKDWVGEEIFYQGTYLNKVGRINGWEEEAFLRGRENGYNQAIQDLTSRIPQLTERIVENVIKENDRAGDFHPDCVVIPLYKLKDTLKGGKE